ncbi:putative transporter yisQ [Proteiniborus sp. DW1]|uniref:MATE family efflux transporter n=1 Tax=Proteiniborus sp. DW1 TaxID=1889883 RepID=UPI00092DF270|nr:MATE family efflux transporter [Proteiniborus sp. DW1]SCG84469.1 putative transporter yisQ [Proteiniborus sp. DW1]
MKRKYFNRLFRDSEFYRILFTIALPIVIQNLIASSLNMLDTVMIGRVGETEIAAVGIANQLFFFFTILIMGFYSGANIFISQFWGNKDETNIKRMLGLSLSIGTLISLIFTFIALVIPEAIIKIFNKDTNVVKLGSDYLRIVGLSYIFTAVTLAYSSALRSIRKTILPMIVSVVALTINALFNYMLIFGNFGMPEMGVNGAALATLIARIAETVLLIICVYIGKGTLAAGFRDMLSFDRTYVVKSFKTILPVVFNEICWGLGAVVYSVAYGRIGTQAIASVQITSTISNLYMVLVFGIANASAVMVGNLIGAGEEEKGKDYAYRLSALGVITGVFIAITIAVTARGMLNIFKVSDTVVHDSLMILYITAVIMVMRVLNIILIVGVLRGGGDAKYSLKLEAFTMWAIGVPLSFIGAIFLKLPVYWVVALLTAEEMVKCFFAVKRLISDKWINRVVHDI